MPVAALPLILLGLFLLLAIFIFLGWLVNKILKRKTINGAQCYLFSIFILFLVHLISSINITIEYFSEYYSVIAMQYALLIGIYLFPAYIAFLLSRRFNKKYKGANENS